MLEELDFEDELPVMESEEINPEQHNSTEEKEADPASGEIRGDEIVDDLEEGEIEDASPVSPIKDARPAPPIKDAKPVPPIRAADLACRFFQQGNCAYGSHCRFLHLPPEDSYQMFDSVISNNNNHNLIIRPAFYNPAFYHHPPMHTEPEFKSAWEVGIENAKIIRQKAKLKRIDDDLGLQDNETAWEISLQETKTMIQRATSKKKKELLGEATIFSKEKFKEQAPVRNFENRFQSSDFKSNKMDDAIDRNSNNDGFNNARKLKSAVGVKKGFCNWDDPWRRSKSPKGKKRPRFRSISSSPRRSHSGKRSSRSSSSSSCFKRRVYGSCSQQKPSSKKKLPKSCSFSPSPLKLRNSFKECACPKRELKHSASRPFSRSPLRNKHSHSCSLSRSSSASSCSLGQKRRKQPKSDKGLKLKKCWKETTTRNSRRPSPKKIWLLKSLSGPLPSPKHSLRKRGIASSPHRSDVGNSSDMTGSSSSCTSSSSVSDTDSSQHGYVVQKDKDFPRSKMRWIPHQNDVRTFKERSSNRMNSNLCSQTALAKGAYKSSITDRKTYLSKRSDTALPTMDRIPNREVLRTVSIKPFFISNRTKLAKPVAMETRERPLARKEVEPQISSSQQRNQRKPKPRKTSAELADSLELLKYQVCVNNNSSINGINKLKAPKKSEITSAVTADPSELLKSRVLVNNDDPISEMNKQKPVKTSAVNAVVSELIKNQELGKNKDPKHKVKQPKPRKLPMTAGDLELLKYQACVPNNSPVEKEICKKSSASLKVSGDSESIVNSDSKKSDIKTEICNKKELLLQQLKLVEAAIARKKYM